jgi:opacity protein-like surface antigen
MRKVALITLCLLVMGSTAFAMDLVMGAGGLYGFSFEEYDYRQTEDHPSSHEDVKATGYGGYIFFGLSRFMEASISVEFKDNASVETWYEDGTEQTYESEYLGTRVGVSVYGKYPFPVSDNVVLFPTIGVDLNDHMGGLDIWLRGGVGVDIFLGKRVFLRGQAIYGIGTILVYKGSLNENTTAGPAHGPIFKLGLGWMY